MKSMIKDALILFAITLVSGLLLGVVNEITKEPIALAAENAKQEAYRAVFPTADSFESAGDVDTSLVFEGADVDEAMKALDASGNLLGYVVTVTDHEGYSGDIQFTLGITTDGTLNGISLLSISETPGLGMQAEEVLVPQFAGKAVTTFEYTKTGATDGSQIDAISGATVTTNAIVNGVNAGISYYQQVLAQE